MTSYWVRWRLKPPASRLFTQPFIQGADERNIKASLAFASGIYRRPANYPLKWLAKRNMFPFDDVIMISWEDSGNQKPFTHGHPPAAIWYCGVMPSWRPFVPINALRPRQNGCYFADDIFKSIFVNERALLWVKFSLQFVLKCPISNITALAQIVAWCRSGPKPLFEPIMA